MVKSSRIFRMYAENERRKFLEDSLKPILNQPLPICCGIEHLDLDRKCRFIGGVRQQLSSKSQCWLKIFKINDQLN